MIDDYRKYKFSAISIKKEIASRFRRFSKEISKSNTEALESMLNFFEMNDLSPEDNLGVKSERTNKRINAVIAILKNIEKHQTKPTTVMLQSLFEETIKVEKEEETEILDFGTPKLITENEELVYYKQKYDQINEQHFCLRNEITGFLNKVKIEKRAFGKNYLLLNLSIKDFEKFRKKNDV
ncbi:BfmA/BtgA family mobilization protein [Confluentibacter sediminis]|uniref:BfmA/BtgA family mobilization protein n=1 Tax=Confluentibacter sediminis TaxID=2219045 RepID=UPI000DADC584|nr:BfmA/BtgA family mobilization protein [Confluentibacter sediminis]